MGSIPRSIKTNSGPLQVAPDGNQELNKSKSEDFEPNKNWF